MHSRLQATPERSFYGERGLLAIEVKRNPRVRDDDLASLRAFGDEYPVAKRFLVHTGKERRHQSGVEILPLTQLLHGLDHLLQHGQLPPPR